MNGNEVFLALVSVSSFWILLFTFKGSIVTNHSVQYFTTEGIWGNNAVIEKFLENINVKRQALHSQKFAANHVDIWQ